MKTVILLKKNGYMKVKNENKLTKRDLEESRWLLVNVTTMETESRNYTLVEPSSLLLFDKAIVAYQLCEKFQDYDYEMNMINFDPVKFTTDSITDVISIINSADKLNIINNLMIEEFTDESGQYGVSYMSVTLTKNNTVIYDKYYEIKGVDGVLFDSYKTVKKFSEIYNGRISTEFKDDAQFIIFKEENGVMRWKLSHNPPEKGMFGYPNIISNSITIMNAYEYSHINKYIGSSIYHYIYYEHNNFINKVTNYIKLGKYNDAIAKMDEASDVFINIYRMLHKSYRDTGFLLSVICNLGFIFVTPKTIFKILYPDSDETRDICGFDNIITLKFRIDRKSVKTLMLNKDTLLTPTQIFNLL